MPQPTLTTVARQAGVSRQSAGFILAGKEHLFRAETVQAVREAAEALGYRPHGPGQALRHGRTNTIGFVQDRFAFRTIRSAELIAGVEARLARSGRQMIYASLAEDANPPDLVRRIIADGLLINYHGNIPPALERATAVGRTPAIYLNVRRGSACVYFDEMAGAETLTLHCLKRWGAMAWVDWDPATAADYRTERHYSITDRRTGYEHACRKAGHEPRFMRLLYGAGVPSAVDQLTSLLAVADRPRGLIVGDGYQVALMAHIAAARHRLSVPDDLAIAGYAPHWEGNPGWPMPTMMQDWDALGATAVDHLLKVLDEPTERLPALGIPLYFGTLG